MRLIKSNALCKSSRAVMLKIVRPHISCLVYSDNWMKSWLQSMNAPPMDAIAFQRAEVKMDQYNLYQTEIKSGIERQNHKVKQNNVINIYKDNVPWQ